MEKVNHPNYYLDSLSVSSALSLESSLEAFSSAFLAASSAALACSSLVVVKNSRESFKSLSEV